MKVPKITPLLVLAGLTCCLGLSAQAQAGTVSDRVKASGTVRVCIWPDYYGITFRSPRTEQLTGIDIELSAEFAKGLGVKLQYVESSFAKLLDDIGNDRCDIAMFAVGITAQRLPFLKFCNLFMSDPDAATTRSSRVVRQWSDIDQPGSGGGASRHLHGAGHGRCCGRRSWWLSARRLRASRA
ncbi:transporter substrate-binding domain-containing protein [Roseateles sp. GG27B]